MGGLCFWLAAAGGCDWLRICCSLTLQANAELMGEEIWATLF